MVFSNWSLYKYKKSHPELVDGFAGLMNLQFGSGFTEILSDIACKTKNPFMRSDNIAVEQNIFMAVKNVKYF